MHCTADHPIINTNFRRFLPSAACLFLVYQMSNPEGFL